MQDLTDWTEMAIEDRNSRLDDLGYTNVLVPDWEFEDLTWWERWELEMEEEWRRQEEA